MWPTTSAVIGVDHMAVLMINHGVITWGKDVEDAYWKMENLEALCKVVWVASQLNQGKLLTMTGSQAKELIAVRKSLGMDDKRANLDRVPALRQRGFPTRHRLPRSRSSPRPAKLDPEAEKLVQALTEQILASLK